MRTYKVYAQIINKVEITTVDIPRVANDQSKRAITTAIYKLGYIVSLNGTIYNQANTLCIPSSTTSFLIEEITE